MRTAILRNVGIVVGIFTAVAIFSTPPLVAQSKNPIAAAKEALRKAKEQQQQQKAQQPPPAPPTETAASPAAHQAPPTAPAGDCCTVDAINRLAASLPKIDIVGVRLGMTMDQAVAAIKASSPTLKIDLLDAELQILDERSLTHKWVSAHTPPPFPAR